MSKNITLLGADYPDVPAVVLPKTGGGSATFVDADNILKNIGSVSANSSVTFTITNNSKIMLVIIGGGTAQGLWLLNCQSTGPMNVFEVKSGAALTVASNANNKITVTNSGSTSPNIYALEFYGTIT